MIVCVVCGGWYIKIATSSTKSYNDKCGLGVVVAILRLLRLFQSLAMMLWGAVLAMIVLFSSLRTKWSNPQTTILLFINRKIKEFTTLYRLRHCEQSEAIHKPLITNTKTEKKKKSPSIKIKHKTKMIYHYLSSQRINFQWNINFPFSIFNFLCFVRFALRGTTS